jgi:hypothetical protein
MNLFETIGREMIVKTITLGKMQLEVTKKGTERERVSVCEREREKRKKPKKERKKRRKKE